MKTEVTSDLTVTAQYTADIYNIPQSLMEIIMLLTEGLYNREDTIMLKDAVKRGYTSLPVGMMLLVVETKVEKITQGSIGDKVLCARWEGYI